MTYFVEIRTTVKRNGPPRLVPLADVGKYRGFRSVFAYDEDGAKRIREQGGTKDLRGLPVYADFVLIDFDGKDPTEFRAWLHQSGLAYEEYDSGNRSVHYHIPLVPIFGPWVPAAVKAWVKRRAPDADISFYHPAGQFRLTGTYHFKQPGRRKELLDRRDGERLVITEASVPEWTYELQDYQEEGMEHNLYMLLTQKKSEGGRRHHAFLIGVTAAEAGVDIDEAWEHLLWWNETFASPPHQPEDLRPQLESAYRRLARKVGNG